VDSIKSAGASENIVEKEDNDWHVVKADGSEEEPGKADEEIARAAEMLGSALFNSDMRSSDENMSTLSNSDSFSVPSTVPSLATQSSKVAPAQRTRWASQLVKLAELGFDDETVCVDVLERLQAANIGVDAEDDDVSVTQAVNAILGQN
jgi:hypothetical protein